MGGSLRQPTPTGPTALQGADGYRQAWRAKMDAVNACYRRQRATRRRWWTSPKPFTASSGSPVRSPWKALQPAEETLDLESPDRRRTGRAGDLCRRTAAQAATNADAYLSNMLRLLRQDGVRFPDNQEAHFDRLDPLPNSILHAEGEWDAGEAVRRVAVTLGPQYGPVTAKQVEDCLWAAYRRGVDDLVFAGFTFDGAAQATIQDDPNPRVRCHMANIRPDVNMGDLLKDTPAQPVVYGLWPAAGQRHPTEGWRVGGGDGRRRYLRPGHQHRASHRGREGGGLVPGQRL